MAKSERINAFDAIRTIAMWLGIVLHSIIAYKTIPVEGWPKDSNFSNISFDWLYDFIHIFRMPLFFLVAGFFTIMVLSRSGVKHFIYQRYRRIFIPFIVGIIFIVPLTLLPFNFFRYRYLQIKSLGESLKLSFEKMLHWGGLAHLWFLYYLLLFYVLFLLYYFLNENFKFPNRFITKINNQKSGVLCFYLISIGFLTLILFLFGSAIPPVYTGIKPKAFHFIYYCFFFGMGFFLYYQYHIIKSFSEFWFLFILVGIIINIVLFKNELHINPIFLFLITAIETVSIVFGFIGYFIKFCNTESTLWRYLSDSAYWVYLVHMGIVAFLQVYFLESSIFPTLKPFLVLFITLGLSLTSYQLFVRFTLIGDFLHGKRTKLRAK